MDGERVNIITLVSVVPTNWDTRPYGSVFALEGTVVFVSFKQDAPKKTRKDTHILSTQTVCRVVSNFRNTATKRQCGEGGSLRVSAFLRSQRNLRRFFARSLRTTHGNVAMEGVIRVFVRPGKSPETRRLPDWLPPFQPVKRVPGKTDPSLGLDQPPNRLGRRCFCFLLSPVGFKQPPLDFFPNSNTGFPPENTKPTPPPPPAPQQKQAQVISPTARGVLVARTTPQPSKNLVEPLWNPSGTLELSWSPRGTLPQGRPGPPRSLSGLRPQSFQLLGKKERERQKSKVPIHSSLRELDLSHFLGLVAILGRKYESSWTSFPPVHAGAVRPGWDQFIQPLL